MRLGRFSLDQLASAITGIAIALMLSLSALALIISILNGQAIQGFQEEHRLDTVQRQSATLQAVKRIESFIESELTDQIFKHDLEIEARLKELLKDLQSLTFLTSEGRVVVISPAPRPRLSPTPTPAPTSSSSSSEPGKSRRKSTHNKEDPR